MNVRNQALVLARLVNWDKTLCPSLLRRAEKILELFDGKDLIKEPFSQTERKEIDDAKSLLKSKQVPPSI
jgi:hypothetical protein